MKKYILLVGFIIAITIPLNAQNPIPNAGFELWTNGEPDWWTTMNFPGFAVPITQTADAYAGSWALRGEVVNSMGGPFTPVLDSWDVNGDGIPVTQSYGALTFYYKFTPVNTAQFSLYLNVFDSNDNLIGSGEEENIPPAAVYSPFSVPIYYFGTGVAAEVIMSFEIFDQVQSTPDTGSFFQLDEVILSAPIAVNENNTENIKLYPNPASDILILRANAPPSEIIICDVAGNEVLQKTMHDNGNAFTERIDISSLANGFYTVKILNAKHGITVQRFLKL